MFWEEKIDKLKMETDPKDFRDPFTDWLQILKKIEESFIVEEDPDYSFSNWGTKVKDKRKVKEILAADLNSALTKLSPRQNYWIVLPMQPGTKKRIYDCKPRVIQKLVQMTGGDFFIAEKKYKWLIYFKRNQSGIEIFKSGDKLTPWDS